MIKIIKYITVCCLLIIFSNTCFGQGCHGFYRNPGCFVKESKYFKQYGQSKSAAIAIDKLYTYQILLYGEKDYIFSLCTEPGFKPMHFRIVDANTKDVIYDNSQDEYNQCIGFSMEKTTTVNLEIEILLESLKAKNIDPDQGRVCIGVQIWWRKIPKLGFN